MIDDRALFGESLATAVNAQAGDVVMRHWRCAQALADLQTVQRDADIVLVCIGRASLTKGSTNQLLKALLRDDSHPPVAVLADTVNPNMVRNGMAMGLGGMIASSVPLGSVISALRQIHSGATVLPNMN
ncbi:DNA-binding response regulator [Azospirillum canadense]|uniref:DNA-binding response regulator n=1 Tax=Azospirillum canadense TaxID=403962 RepID=UPI002227ECAB|nr:DNA-binding response regulator [Azospirillum canadense]MCW2238577.1 DNA-binding NarL/FixJ family response regulator [Azospirillum canadense]